MAREVVKRPKAPFFFMSYARSPIVNDAGQFDGDEDKDVIEFYKDLCRHIRNLAIVDRGVHAGYLDRAMRTSVHWDDEVKGALATCQTFVALYKPSYFESEWCGREWAAFETRQNLTKPRGSVAHDAIIPVLWVEERRLPDPLPAAARYVQHSDLGPPPRYRTEGVYGLRNGEHVSDYRKTTLAIARLIVDVAAATRIPPCRTSAFLEEANAFRPASK